MLELNGVDKMLVSLAGANTSVKEQSKIAMDSAMIEAEVHAKANAPWQDRTGNARLSITGLVTEVTNKKITGALFIGMEYGVYLELANGGKYQIIWNTLEWEGQRLPQWLAQVKL